MKIGIINENNVQCVMKFHRNGHNGDLVRGWWLTLQSILLGKYYSIIESFDHITLIPTVVLCVCSFAMYLLK